MPVTINTDYMIPLSSGQAVSKGWTSHTNYEPVGIMIHWTAASSLFVARKVLGGKKALRKGVASAHFCVGESTTIGIDQYVDLDNRSWHCGAGQTIGPYGDPYTSSNLKGARTHIGIEVTHPGFFRRGVSENLFFGGKKIFDPFGQTELLIAPWPEPVVRMTLDVVNLCLDRWPSITTACFHCDLCPGYKIDALTFPIHFVLNRVIYNKTKKVELCLPDIWEPFYTIEGRQKALVMLDYDLGNYGIDGHWGRISSNALVDFQRENNLAQSGAWTTHVCLKVYEKFLEKDLTFEDIRNG